QEPTQAEHVDDQAALVLLADVGLDHRPVGLLLRRHKPGGLGASPPEAEDDVALLVLRLEHEHLDLVARFETERVDLAAQSKLFARDHAVSLAADLDQRLIRLNTLAAPD